LPQWRTLFNRGYSAREAAKARNTTVTAAKRWAAKCGLDWEGGDRVQREPVQTAPEGVMPRIVVKPPKPCRKVSAERIVLRGGVAAYPDQIRAALAQHRGRPVVYAVAGPGECEAAKAAAREVAEQTGARLVSWPVTTGAVREFACAIQGGAA
jgi:hypothetical protein